MLKQFLAYATFFGLVLWTSVSSAQGIAHSDVFFTYGETKIEVTPQEGRLSLPQTMPVGGFFAQANTNPGFFSERDVGGGTGANDVVGYNVLGDLVFWSEGEFATPNSDTVIRIINNPGSVEDALVGTGTGEQRAMFEPLTNSIGQSSGNGDFHSHVDFRLEPISSDPDEMPLFGAYGLRLSLSSDNPDIEESDPFFIVYEFGLDDEQFNEALDDFDAMLSMSDSLPGDFDSDGQLSAFDIDLLSAEVRAGTNTASFDLTGDATVDDADRTIWVEELAGSLSGDANLDGSVQFSDFLALSASFGSAGGWANGDFDGNGEVQFPDFLRLSANFGSSAVASQSVPEPRTSMPLAGALVLFSAFRRRRRVA